MRIEPTTFQTLVGCSNHWPTKNSSDQKVICGLTQPLHLTVTLCRINTLMKKSRIVMKFDLYGTVTINHSKHILILFMYNASKHKFSKVLIVNAGGVLPYITYTGMCRPTGSWFWSSWFRTGYPFQRRFLEQGIKNCGSRLYLLLKIVADYEEAFIWCISRTNKEISF